MIRQLRFDMNMLLKQRSNLYIAFLVELLYLISSMQWKKIPMHIIEMEAVLVGIIFFTLLGEILHQHIEKGHTQSNVKTLMYFPTTRRNYYASKCVLTFIVVLIHEFFTLINLVVTRYIWDRSITEINYAVILFYIAIFIFVLSGFYMLASLNAWLLQYIIYIVIILASGLIGAVIGAGDDWASRGGNLVTSCILAGSVIFMLLSAVVATYFSKKIK